MKEIIKIERFLDSIIQNVWRNNDSKHHKTNYSLYSDFGNYPDLNDFETELLTVDRELIDDKIKNIKEKCNELIEFYDIKISNLPIGNGTVTIGKLNLNPIDLKYNEAENAASITIEVYEKIENNSKLTVLHFDDNDLINTIEKIKAIVEKTNEADNEAPKDEKLTTGLNQVRMKAIHQWLQANKYINVDIDSWLYWFSLQTWLNKKKKPSKIKWTNAAYHLPNVVYLICGNMNKFTEKAMQKSFTLQKGSKFQKVTTNNIKRDKEPYKSLYKIIEYAEKNIKDLQ